MNFFYYFFIIFLTWCLRSAGLGRGGSEIVALFSGRGGCRLACRTGVIFLHFSDEGSERGTLDVHVWHSSLASRLPSPALKM